MKIILDTDPGVGIPGTDADDPIALLLALADPRLELLGVTTTFGNCPPSLGARGAAAVLRAAGRTDVPVSVGAGVPLSGRLPAVLEAAYRGDRGREGRIPLPPLEESVTGQRAPDFVIDTVRAHPGEVTVVAIGPQTNLALALIAEPAVARDLAGVVFMGGALGLDPVYGKGNITPAAECNIYFDPLAADIVFRSGVDLTMVSLDVTNPGTGLVLTKDAVQAIDTSVSGRADMLARVCETYLAAPMFDLGHGCVLYDPLAVAAAADPDLGDRAELAVAVETRGDLTTGQTVVLPDAPPNLTAMTTVDGAAAVRDIVAAICA